LIVETLVRRTALRVEPLSGRARREFSRFVDADPLVNSAVAARLRQVATIEAARFGGDVLGVRTEDRQLAAAVFNGGNLLPIGGGPNEWAALAEYLADRPRVCTSIVGRATAVASMWQVLAPAWGPARAIRDAQPLLVLEREDGLDGGADSRVRRIRQDELEQYLPAAAAMFTEELGVSPYQSAGVGDYRRRVAGLINEGRAFGIVDRDGSVLFKADVGAVSAHTCQLHGVWVRPDRRGQGIGRAGLAAVLRHALTLAPSVSLYVNDYNTAARRMYARLGMREVATLSTVLF
jgi:predicted GNAT family acetyltransferase